MAETPFNLNNYVMVQLTERGHDIHRENQDRTTARYFPERYPYERPHEDENGWSKWQAWDFMRTFGPYMGNGLNVPVLTEIKFIT